LRRQISCRRFFCPAFPPSPPLFTFDASVLPSAAHVCPVCRFAVRAPSGRHRAGRFLTSSAALVISLPPLPGSGKTEHRFCAFLPPSRRPFLGPARRISRL